MVQQAAFAVRAARLALGALRERRLPLSPRRWLIDLRHLRGVMSAERDTGLTAARTKPLRLEQVRAALAQTAAAELGTFLSSGSPLPLVRNPSPVVSVVLVLFNRAELTFRCLRSLAGCSIPLDVVIVDNGSSDSTASLLDRLEGAVVIRQAENAGFASAVNTGARAASGRYLLLLNNDAELLPGALESALHTFELTPRAGAVGGKLILPDGRLQEAATIVWRDGSCQGYGRGQPPEAPAFAFQRDVDMCSAAFLLTPRQLFLDLGGFDPAFDPAYYEDADYCVRLWKAGRRVIYEPRATVMHHEFASSSSRFRAARLQLHKRRTFVGRHAAWLQGQLPAAPGNVLRARERPRTGRRVLVFDDRVPRYDLGSGFPRAVELLRQLCALGHFVTFYPLSIPRENWNTLYRDIPGTVEVMVDHGLAGLSRFMRDRHGFYDAIVVSRHHNMQRLGARLGPAGSWGGRVIYDAEAVSAPREIERRRLAGESVGEQQAARLIRDEVELARGADVVLAVSELEKQLYTEGGASNVVIARHAVEAAPTPRRHEEREGVLFVGAFAMLSPNADSVLWFSREVRPKLQAALGHPVSLAIAGLDAPEEVLALADDSTSILSDARDLVSLYDRARLFVAPTRFAAGIPLKVIHAAAHGVPVVCTTLLARQLGWCDGVELLAADTPDEFASKCASLYQDEALWQRLRDGALARIEREYATEVFRTALRKALDRSTIRTEGSR